MFTDLIASLKRTRARAHQDAVRDWLILVTISSIALAGIIVWNVWAFDTVASGRAIGSSAPKVAPIFDPVALEAVRKVFANRAAEEAKYISGVYRYADPSQ
ncbi:MAG: hypothetical protein PHD04_00630 [Candidatus Pacebacteria bacterium]|nr:hypothetical protein [Candidatus Paceibacterota bacterium]